MTWRAKKIGSGLLARPSQHVLVEWVESRWLVDPLDLHLVASLASGQPCAHFTCVFIAMSAWVLYYWLLSSLITARDQTPAMCGARVHWQDVIHVGVAYHGMYQESAIVCAQNDCTLGWICETRRLIVSETAVTEGKYTWHIEWRLAMIHVIGYDALLLSSGIKPSMPAWRWYYIVHSQHIMHNAPTCMLLVWFLEAYGGTCAAMRVCVSMCVFVYVSDLPNDSRA